MDARRSSARIENGSLPSLEARSRAWVGGAAAAFFLLVLASAWVGAQESGSGESDDADSNVEQPPRRGAIIRRSNPRTGSIERRPAIAPPDRDNEPGAPGEGAADDFAGGDDGDEAASEPNGDGGSAPSGSDDDRDAKKELPRTVLLPDIGVYRAPAILRLAGELEGLPVRVARRELNDREIRIPPQLALRHVTRTEIRVVLAAHSLFLFPWEHPKHGAMLVAADEPNWEPPRREFRRMLNLPSLYYDEAVKRIQEEIERKNKGLPAKSESFYAALPIPRKGRVLVVGPSAEGLVEIIQSIETTIETREASRVKLDGYRPRHRRAQAIYDDLVSELGAAELERARVRLVPWQNILLFQGDEDLRKKIVAILERFDDVDYRGRTRRSSSTGEGRVPGGIETGSTDSTHPEPPARDEGELGDEAGDGMIEPPEES